MARGSCDRCAVSAPKRSGGRAPAQDRLGRLLAIVPWVAANDGPTVAEVCERFGVGEAELLADLDLLFLCGVYPFTPDTLIEVDVADGRVWIRFADYFRRPLRLTAPEGLALIGAGAALLAMPGSDPDGALAGALAKLEAVLGFTADDAVDVALAPVAANVLETVRAATAGRRKVELDYYSFGRDESSTRVVQPWRVFNATGQWYMSAWCEMAAGERLFRIDRIRSARRLDASFDRPPEADGPTALFHPDPAAPAVVLDLQAPAHWIAERYPNEGVEALPDGVLRVRLRVGERAWLERLLLRAGPSATVVEGDRTVGPAAARRLLARYAP
jgi:proteasome accessory factor C